MDDKFRKTFKCIVIGTSIYNLFLIIFSTIVFIFYYKSKNIPNFTITIIKNEVSVIIGYIVSILGLYSIASSLKKSISSNDADYAKKHMTFMSIIRFVFFCIILIIIINKNVFGISGGLMYVLSVFGIKIGAYLSPQIEKHLK